MSFVFGYTKEGQKVTAYILENRRGARATVLDYGCIIQELRIPNAHGLTTDVVLGYDTVKEYEENSAYIGAVIGRMANRIGGSKFTINEKTYHLAQNNGANHLHGGIKGFDKYVWDAEMNGSALTLSRISPDGEENYPGNLTVKVKYNLTDDNELIITYDAYADADTIVNLTNHSYFNLNGKGSVLDHYLQIHAKEFTENDRFCLPTGKLLSTEGTPFDFNTPKQIGRDIDKPDQQLIFCGGYDHNFVLSHDFMKEAALLYSTETGISMKTYTTLPGVQLYTGNSLYPHKGKNGSLIERRGAVCLETQVFPNAMAFPHFPSPVLRKGENYHTETIYRFEML